MSCIGSAMSTPAMRPREYLPPAVTARLWVDSKSQEISAVVDSARLRDVNESDTVIVVTDMLWYDKYSEITSELCIKGSYCDLATKVDTCTLRARRVVTLRTVLPKTRRSQTRSPHFCARKAACDFVSTNDTTRSSSCGNKSRAIVRPFCGIVVSTIVGRLGSINSVLA